MIDVAGCADGHGDKGFYHNIADNDPAEFERACIDRPKDETLPDQWTSQIFARILAHHPVIMVTDLCDHQMLKDMHMTPVNTIEEALKLAFEMKGADAKVGRHPRWPGCCCRTALVRGLNESFITDKKDKVLCLPNSSANSAQRPS